MVSPRIGVLVRKEWAELVHQRALIWMTLLIPVIFLGLTFSIAFVLPALMGERAYGDPDLAPLTTALLRHSPELAGMTPRELFQVVILRQFVLFLLIVPVMAGVSISTYSIVGEKVNRSLEPLLATPIRTNELLWAKCLAAAIPAVLLAWTCFALYAGGVVAFGMPRVFDHVINATTLCTILLVAPTIAVLGLSLGIIASSRSTDPRSAQQIAVVVILPLAGLYISQMTGLFFLTPFLVVLAATLLAAVDALVLKVGAALFRRETILTRWR